MRGRHPPSKASREAARQRRAPLRREARAARARLDAAQITRAAQRLCQRLAQLPAFTAATGIAGYMALAGEMDPVPALALAVEQGKRVYVPIIAGQTLVFATWTPTAAMLRNRFGIAEPAAPAERLEPMALDLVLVPLLGFDAQCNRLGLGGGYYDRSFAAKLDGEPGPLLVGVAHDSQRLERLEPESWDVPLDCVVTDREIYLPPGREAPP